MKKFIITLLIAAPTFGFAYAADFTIGIETTSNGFAFTENDGFMSMDLGLDVNFGFYGKKGLGGYLNGGYNLQSQGTDLISTINHGVSADLGFAYKKAISRSTDFLFSTGFGMNYIFTKKVFNMDYNLGLDFLFNIGKNGYIKLGAGYQLKFLNVTKDVLRDELRITTYVDNHVLVPTVGFGFKF